MIDDIDLAGYVFDKAVIAPDVNETNWWFDGTPFTGVFDGNDHTISNLTITGGRYLGLFGQLGSWNVQALGEIKNLGVLDVNVAGSGLCVGGLVGKNYYGGITTSYSTGTVSGLNNVGGLVGYNRDSAFLSWYIYYMVAVTHCYSTSAVSGDSYVGGLVGYNCGTVTECYSTGEVNGTDYSIGGLVGSNDGDVIQCYSTSGVNGNNGVGGLVGSQDRGTVTQCYSTGIVSGTNCVGGLVGENAGKDESLAMIFNSYAKGSVTGFSHVGGLVGKNGYYRSSGWMDPPYRGIGTIFNCYSVSTVTGSDSMGGLVGSEACGQIDNSFWDIQISGQSTSAGGVGLTTAQMKDPNIFMAYGWDFVGQPDGPSDIWAKPEDGSYPVLWWQLSPWPELPIFSGGTGQEDDPYLISTAQELNSIGYNPRLMDAHFKLINDVNLSGVNFFTIGNELQLQGYAGVFDGNGYKISNLTIDSNEVDNIGLFGYVRGGTIMNLGLIDANIDAQTCSNVGSLVGYLEQGSIINCNSVGGSVSGNSFVGGLVGYNIDSTVNQCYSKGAVSGNWYIGGLVGDNSSGVVIQSYSTGMVSGTDYVGGLVGEN
jgi:hypothetical protein